METHIHESNLIEGYDSEEADKQSLEAWEWLIQKPKLTHDVIKKLQFKLVEHQKYACDNPHNSGLRGWRGQYRKLDVHVGGRACMPPPIVTAAMTTWLEEYQKTNPKDAHIAFEKIHPFLDGNGRTGRMLMWYQEEKLGKKPTLIKYQDRRAYYDWFN